MKVGLRLVGGAMGLAVVLAGCGELDSDNSLSGPQARYVAQADPVCAEARAAVGGKLGVDPEKEFAAVLAARDKLRAIPAPNEDIDQLRVFLNHFSNLSLSLDDLVQSNIVNNETRAATALTRARESDRLAADTAGDYGFENCSRGIEAPEE